MRHENDWPFHSLLLLEPRIINVHSHLTFVRFLLRQRSDTSCSAWSCRNWRLTCLPCVFTSYPQHHMRAFGMSFGRRSRSQCVPFAAVHVSSRCPFKPWTATMLGTVSTSSCDGTDGLLHRRLLSLRNDLEAKGRYLRRFLRLRWIASLLQRQPGRGRMSGLISTAS